MADLDRLLSEDRGAVARRAEEAAVVPEFAAVVRRGRARRTRRQAGVLGAAALAVAGIVASVQLLGPGGSEPSPAPSPAVPTVPTDPTDPTDPAVPTHAQLSALVDAPESGLVGLATTPGAPEQRATVWQVDDGERWVLALTGDDYAHRRLVEVPVGSGVATAGDGRFVVRESWEGRRLSVLDVDGGATPVVVDGEPAPLGGDEVPVVLDDSGTSTLVAVAPDARAHPVPTPDGALEVVVHAHRITVLSSVATGGFVYHWSDDGGASWQQTGLGDGFLPMVARSAIGQSHAVLEGGDGATLFPLLAVQTASAADPATWTRTTIDRGERWPTVTGSWIDRDGKLRVLASFWEKRGNRPVDAGVWLVEGSGLVQVPTDHPDPAALADTGLLHIEYVDGPVLWARGTDDSAWRSADDGATWERFATR